MATQQEEETQAKEFLKRAEIRTMKKDLQALREVDALSERDKIAKIKTLEEQLEEKKKAEVLAAPSKEKAGTSAYAKTTADKATLEEVLQRGEGQERIAEKDLKNYASEEERQKIFLLESQRLGFEKQVDDIDQKRDPELKLEKNKLLLQKRDQQAKLNTILEQDKKLEDEEKTITEKEQTTTIATQRKSLEEARWDLDKKIQEVEKKRWAVEKELEDIDNKVSEIDKSSEMLVEEKNKLRDKILGVDKSLREIYSVVMAREEGKRRGLGQEQVAKREALEKSRAQQNEKVQRQQWSGAPQPKNDFTNNVPVPSRNKITKSFAAEDEQRKKFMQDVEQGTKVPGKGQSQQKSNIN